MWDTEVALICPEGPKRKRRKPRDARGEARKDDPGGAREGEQASRGDVGESPDCLPPRTPGDATLERLGPQCRAQQPLDACPGRGERREEDE